MKKNLFALSLFFTTAVVTLLFTGCAHSREDLVSLPDYTLPGPSYKGAPCVFIESTEAYPGNAKAASLIKRELEDRGVVVIHRKNLADYKSFRKAQCVICVNTVMERISEELNDDTFARDVLLVVSVAAPGNGDDVLGEQGKIYFSAWSRDFLDHKVEYRPFVEPSADLSVVVKNLLSLPGFQQKIMACKNAKVLDPVPFVEVADKKSDAAVPAKSSASSAAPASAAKTSLSNDKQALILEYQKKTNAFTQQRNADLKKLEVLKQKFQKHEINAVEYRKQANVLIEKINKDVAEFNKYVENLQKRLQ